MNDALNDKLVVVTGGTGNVGAFIAQALLARGATVAVPSRSESRLQELRAHLARRLDAAALGRLHSYIGDLVDDATGPGLVRSLEAELGPADAVIATLGRFRASASLLTATRTDLDEVMQDYLYAHLAVAQRFMPGLRSRGGAYLLINGPLAFEARDGSALVSIATAAQHMLFEALLNETAGSRLRLYELVSYAFIRGRETQPSSALPGEALGSYASYLVSDAGRRLAGRSLHLRSLEALEAAGLA